VISDPLNCIQPHIQYKSIKYSGYLYFIFFFIHARCELKEYNIQTCNTSVFIQLIDGQ